MEFNGASNEELPKFVIFGGVGFIGRHLVDYLIERSSKIYVIDKTPPEIAWLNEKQLENYRHPKVTFISANLISPAGCEKAFESIEEDSVDYIINLASETRKGQSESVYREGIFKLSGNLVSFVAKKFGGRFKTFVEFSTGSIYANDKSPHKESDKLDSNWSFETKYKALIEKEIGKTIKNYVILRPGIVYGIGDRIGITPRLVIGAIYRHLNEMMKLPWNSEVKTHTIHVEDLVAATVYLCLFGKHGEIYNVVDESDTSMGSLCDIISDIFNINHDYWGSALTTLAKMDGDDAIVEEINDKHLTAWATLCQQNGVNNTPLTPYITADSLSKRHISLSGEKLKKITEVKGSWPGSVSDSFKFKYPILTKEILLEVIEDYMHLNLFPKSSLE